MKFRTKLLLGVFLVMLGLVVAWELSGPEPLPPESVSASILKDGPYRVGTERKELVDTSRATDPNGDAPGAPQRTLDTRIWFPLAPDGKTVAGGTFPLIVYSHGFYSTNEEPRYLARFLASHGYIVVAPSFPLTNFFAPGGATVFDLMNQPGDISFLIDTMLAWSDDSSNPFHRRVDPNRIGVAGTSLGGMTTELAAYHPRVGDQRIKAAVSMAGPLQLFGRAFFEKSTLPFMMIAADNDAMVPYAENALPVLDRVNNAWLVTIRNGSHTGFGDQATMFRWLDNADSIGCFFIRGKTPNESDDPGYYDEIGTVEEGILRNMTNTICQMHPLPDAISPMLQQRITVLAAYSFFEQVFNADEAARNRYRDYLKRVLPAEISGVKVERSSPPAAT